MQHGEQNREQTRECTDRTTKMSRETSDRQRIYTKVEPTRQTSKHDTDIRHSRFRTARRTEVIRKEYVKRIDKPQINTGISPEKEREKDNYIGNKKDCPKKTKLETIFVEKWKLFAG